MTNGQGNKRIASYELLRVIAMFMVIILHFNARSQTLMTPGTPITPNGVAAGLLESFCIAAVNVYVLITGYFMCEATYRIRRLVRLWLQIAFYTIMIPAALTLLSVPIKGQQGLWQIIKYIMPISTEHYWFATAYFLLYLLMPVLNKAVHALTRRQFKTVICALLLFTCVAKTISPVELTADNYGYDTLWFVVLYLIAAYIRQYDVPRFNHPIKAAGTFAVSCIVIFAMHVGLHAYNLATGALEYYAAVPLHYNYLFTLTAAIGLFYLFKFVHIREGILATFARSIAPYTFGVYLIHEHIDVRDRWVSGFNVIFGRTIATSPLAYLVQAIIYAILLYAICIIIEMIRTAIFHMIGEHIAGSWLDRKIDEVDALFR